MKSATELFFELMAVRRWNVIDIITITFIGVLHRDEVGWVAIVVVAILGITASFFAERKLAEIKEL